jgi:hypothetical protein
MPLPISTALFITSAIIVAAWSSLTGEIVATSLAGVALVNETGRFLAARTPRISAPPARPRERQQTPIVGSE